MNRDISRTLDLSIISQMSTVEWQLVSRVLLYITYYSKYKYIRYYQGYCIYNIVQYSRSNSNKHSVETNWSWSRWGENDMLQCMHVCVYIIVIIMGDGSYGRQLILMLASASHWGCAPITSNFSHGMLKTWKGLSMRLLATYTLCTSMV